MRKEKYLNKEKINAVPSIKKAPKRDYYPVSLQQEGIWLQSKIDPGSIIWNTSHSWRFQGQLNIEALKRVIRELIYRHAPLRTNFRLKEDKILQFIHNDFSFDSYFKYINLSSYPPGDIESEAKRLEKQVTQQIYDLEKSPLARFTVIRLNKGDHLIVIGLHHIITDVTSRQILWKEFVTLYNSYAFNKPHELEPIDIHYHDYALWQQEFLKTSDYEKQGKYWMSRLASPLPVLNLPLDFPRCEKETGTAKIYRYTVELHHKLATRLRSFGLRSRVPFSAVFLSAFYILLNKYSGQDDIVIGTLYNGRNINKNALNKIIGLYANFIAMRLNLNEDTTINKLLKEADRKTREAYENQNFRYEDLIRNLHPERTTLHGPIFQSVFNMIKFTSLEMAPEGLIPKKWDPYKPDNEISSQYDLSLYVRDEFKKITLRVLYTKDRFTEETIKRMVEQYIAILSGMSDDPGKKLIDMSIITAKEKQQILFEFNDTDNDYPRNKTIYQLFEEQVERTPDHIALVGAKEFHKLHEEGTRGLALLSTLISITYKQLNQKSHQLSLLLKEKGIKPGVIVGIMLERSVDMITGIFGIVKAGGAYLPIDPQYPEERINYILADSRSNILLTSQEEIEKLNCMNEKIVNGQLSIVNCQLNSPLESGGLSVGINRGGGVCQNLHQSPAPVTSLAYLIYTSGSTGKPKGVMIEHWTLVNRLNWMQKTYPIGPGDSILHKTPFTFDVSVWEIYWWSLVGAKVCLLPPGGEKDPRCIRDAIYRHHVTVMHFVPSMLNIFLEYLKQSPGTGPKPLSSLKQIIASGEALTVSQVKAFKQILYKNSGTRLANLYGPTEATIDVSFYDCPVDTEGEIHRIPIGKPIDNIHLLVLNGKMHLQPLGVTGELYITGDGLARGYLNRPELTSEKFARDLWDDQDNHDEKKLKLKGIVIHDAEPHPETMKLIKSFCGGPGGGFLEKSPPGRRRQNIYRTGDLARWLPDGNIEFLGRVDNQVKIRGNRIELGEIEARLNQQPGIKESIVIASVDQAGGAILCAYVVSEDAPNVEEIRKNLENKLPGYMVPSYYVRVKRIPLTANGKVDRKALPGVDKSLLPKKKYTPPGSDVEKRLVEIWEELLGRERIGIHDSFFELGGHSLTVINLALRIRESFGHELTMAAIFDNPTVSGLARLILTREEKQRKFQQILQEIESMTEEKVRTLLEEHNRFN